MIPELIKRLRGFNSQLIEINDRMTSALGTLMGHTPDAADKDINTEPYCQADEITQILLRTERELDRQQALASRLDQVVGADTAVKAMPSAGLIR